MNEGYLLPWREEGYPLSTHKIPANMEDLQTSTLWLYFMTNTCSKNFCIYWLLKKTKYVTDLKFSNINFLGFNLFCKQFRNIFKEN